MRFKLFIYFMKWFCKGVDQFDAFKVKVNGYNYYVEISMQPTPGVEEEFYRELK